MAEYRLYCLDERGKITKSHELVAASDEDAIDQAVGMRLGVDCELRQRERLVIQLQAAAAIEDR